MPLTTAQHEKRLKVPAVCELLPLRDILDDVIVRTNGAFVAGYELHGTLSYFATDEDRNQAKSLIEALLRSIPDVSMRVQFRYEISEDLGTLLEDYVRTQSTTQSELMALDTHRLEMWQAREREGHYFGIRLHAYFIWDPRVHAKIYHSTEKKRRDGGIVFSQKKCIERARKEHETLLNEFESIMRGVAASLEAASLGPRRLNDQELFEEMERAQVPALLPPLAAARRPARTPQCAGAGSGRQHPERVRELPEHRWVSALRGQSEGAAGCHFPGHAAAVLNRGLSDCCEWSGDDSRPGEGAQRLQEAAQKDDRCPEGQRREP
jgi:hypothetical protein